MGTNIEFWHLQSYFDIWHEAEYRLLTFKIPWWHSKQGWILHLDINFLFWLSNWRRISHFDIQNPILTLEMRPIIVFWNSKSYFDIRTQDEDRILTFKILFWQSKWGWISFLRFKILFWHSIYGQKSHFDIKNPIMKSKCKPNIVALHLKSYFDVQNEAKCIIWTFIYIYLYNISRGWHI